MKKILLLIIFLVLVGCKEEHKEISYKLEDIHPMPIEKKEMTSHFVYDDWMPLYAELLSYPDESLIDWNEETYQIVSNKDTLEFVFTKVEAVYGINISSESIEGFKLKSGDLEWEIRGQAYSFNTPLLTDSLTLVPISNEPFKLIECHILVGDALDDQQYETYQAKKIFLENLQSKYLWKKNPYENFDLAFEVVNLFDLDLLLDVSHQVDYTLLSEEALGMPIEIIGQVLSVESQEDIQEVKVKVIGSDEEIVIFTHQEVIVDNMFMTTGLYLGELLNKFFYDIK